jgi:arsenate reductase
LELLRQQKVPVKVVEYLKMPLNVTQLQALVQKLGVNVRDLLRDGEAEFQQLHLSEAGKTEAELLAAIAQYPILLQRPIVVCGDRAVIARPPERLNELVAWNSR